MDGTTLVKLKKALYGLHQAPRVWFDTIRAFLLYNGFIQSKLDDCLFYKQYADGTSIDITIHVDDGLITMNTQQRLSSLLVALKDEFKILKVSRGSRLEYLSMVFEFDRDSRTVSVTMPKYVDTILDDYPLDKYKAVPTPHDKDLFRIQESKNLAQVAQKIFHTTVMRILFFTSRVRPDLLGTVNSLPREHDLELQLRTIIVS